MASRPETDVDVAGECGSVSEAVEALRVSRVDLVLLDVKLPDGTGFDVIRRIGPARMPPVVFATAFDEYAIQAFEVNAIDYLLKPFDQERLLASVDKVRERQAGAAEALTQRLEALMQAREARWARDARRTEWRSLRLRFSNVRGLDRIG